MSDESQPQHLNNHHRRTVMHIFQHPISHNIEWRSVESLLNAIGTVEESHDGKFRVTVGEHTEVFHRPRHKDISTQQVVSIRHILTEAGFSAS